MARAPELALDPFAEAFLADPYASLAEARRQWRVFFNPVIEMYVVTRYGDVSAALRAPQSLRSGRPSPRFAPEVQAVLDTGHAETSILVNDDPPRHTRLRALVSRGFAQREIDKMEPLVRERATSLLDAAPHRTTFDLVSTLAYPLPLQVICAMIGVPEGDADEVKRWSDDWVLLTHGQVSVARKVECARSLVAFQEFMGDLVERRRARAEDDMATRLVESRLDGEALTTPEIAMFLMGLLLAGHETTTNLITNTVLHLVRGGLWQRVASDPSVIGDALEETLRYDAPVQGMPRSVATDTQIADVDVPAGARVWLSFASANRDEAEHDDPDRFMLGRGAQNRHLGFGKGIHFCLGAQLARLEARIALTELASRAPRLALAPGHALSYVPNLVHRGPKSLLVMTG